MVSVIEKEIFGEKQSHILGVNMSTFGNKLLNVLVVVSTNSYAHNKGFLYYTNTFFCLKGSEV